MARTILVEDIVRGTFAYPEGCDDQKRAFLHSLGISDSEIEKFRRKLLAEPVAWLITWNQRFSDVGLWYTYAAVRAANRWYTTSSGAPQNQCPTNCSWAVLADWLDRWKVSNVQVAVTTGPYPV